MKKEKSQNIEVPKIKHVKTRIIIFIIAIVCAISGIGYGIYALITSKAVKTGWSNITITSKSEYHAYDENVALNYYVDSSNGRNPTQNQSLVRNALNQAGSYFYQFLDADYDDYKVKGMGYINSHPNEKIEIEPVLYNVLEDAYQKTIKENSHYSIFSGLLKYYWFTTIQEEGYNLDPLYDEERMTELNDILEISTLDNYSLKLEKKEEKYYVTFSYSEEVKKLMEDYGYTCSVLDLNSLFYSYYLSLISTNLIKNGYTKGYLYSYTGEQIFLSNTFTSSNDIFIYDNDGENVTKPGYLKIKGKCVASLIKSFPTTTYESLNTYHIYKNNSKTIIHSMFYNYKLGYSSNLFNTSLLVDTDENASLVDLTYTNLECMFNFENKNGYKDLSSKYVSYILSNDKGKIYVNEETSNYYTDYYENYELLII